LENDGILGGLLLVDLQPHSTRAVQQAFSGDAVERDLRIVEVIDLCLTSLSQKFKKIPRPSRAIVSYRRRDFAQVYIDPLTRRTRAPFLPNELEARVVWGAAGALSVSGGTSAVFSPQSARNCKNLLAVRLYRELRQLKLRRRTLDAITLSAEPRVILMANEDCSLAGRLAAIQEGDRIRRCALLVVDCIRKMRLDGLADMEIVGLFHHAADELDKAATDAAPVHSGG
jgi:hypothetical protein